MGVGEDDRRWTIRVCAWCDRPTDAHENGPTIGGLPSKLCEAAPRGLSYALVGERTVQVVVPAAVVDGLRGEVERLRTALARRVPAEVPMWETGGQAIVWVENHEDAADRELLASHGLRPLGGVNRGHRERIAASVPVVSLEQEDNR